ncbi:uncharacterized protein LOC108736903 [Agrilus planipennis]|uniref:Uncharacterized protein LOC108736903 n=1 Tax=Agrilus planipennis TaxID=224129 RepID=A0A1W4WWW9_AGRPL|nr:uncharacterized protein LOC108736903 [Agrilus planipennis]
MELGKGFEIPKKTTKLTYDQRTATKKITTSNSFEVLHCESTDQPKIPPVIIHYNEDWNQIRKKLQLNNVKFDHFTSTKNGVRIQPCTEEDHSRLTALLDKIDCYYYTYTCDRKRPIKYVIKGIPTSLSCDDVSNDLEGKGISDTTVHRMKSRSKEIPLVLIFAPKKWRTKSRASRHVATYVFQLRCTANCDDPRNAIAASALDMSKGTCTKPREEPAKCRNCEGPHPASYRGCKAFTTKTPKTPKQINTTKATASIVRQAISYAKATAGKPRTENPSTSTETTTIFDKIDLTTFKTAIINLANQLKGATTPGEILLYLLGNVHILLKILHK